MTLSDVGALVLSGSGGLGAGPVTPAYGVAFRFSVDIGGLDLGDWQSCSGLKVDFKPTEMKAGGNYLGSRWLAGEASYSRIVLKRAAVQASSERLQAWLRDQGISWLNGQEDPDAGAQCTITLFDSSGEPVMWWVLDHARPAAWSGPDLDAGASRVAIETLELVHSGFSVGTGSQAPRSRTSSPGAATGAPACTLKEDASKVVRFTFPPTQIGVVKRQTSTTTEGATTTRNTAVRVEETFIDGSASTPNITTYKLDGLILWGPTTRASVELLDVWATKTEVQGAGTTQPKLVFTWGSGFNGVPVQVKSLSATYTRFTADGVPTRAKVDLQLEQCGPTPPATGTSSSSAAYGASNPTSGGIPGRGSHLVLETDTLPALAHKTYGDPTAWRVVAEANRIDDPLRVAPGTTLLLPAPAELPTVRREGDRR